LKNYRAGAA